MGGFPMSYFVVGLPRSRTAWLSVFLSQSGRFCHHEGLNGCRSLDEYSNKLNNGGDSSTGLMMIKLNKLFPDSPVVIIEKNHEQVKRCIKWCDDTYGGDSRDYIYQLNEQMKEIKGLRINQSDINDRLHEIWRYLIDMPWKETYTILKDFNIQSDPFNIDAKAAKELFNGLIQ